MNDLTCPACGGPPRWAAHFGPLVQCQCRNCGIGYSTPAPEDDYDEEFDDDEED